MENFDRETAVRQFLTQSMWPIGLQNALIQSIQSFPVRFMIVDDSGSMMANDGHIILQHQGKFVSTECSRWSELTAAMAFHAHVAELAHAPTEFRLLNGSTPVVVGRGDDNGQNLSILNALLSKSPGGGTPLCHHIREVTTQIQAMEGLLRSNGQRAVVVVATDGESSDGDIASAMAPLRNLPVWVVIRLCTDSEAIVDYWNNIDQQLELEMDILDDLAGEAAEVTANNKWLTYGEPLHRLREWGIHLKEMDLLDEGALSPEQMKAVVCMILDLNSTRIELPHPAVDWPGFIHAVTEANNREPMLWDPLSRSMSRWIKINQLNRQYNKSRHCAGMGCTLS